MRVAAFGGGKGIEDAIGTELAIGRVVTLVCEPLKRVGLLVDDSLATSQEVPDHLLLFRLGVQNGVDAEDG